MGDLRRTHLTSDGPHGLTADCVGHDQAQPDDEQFGELEEPGLFRGGEAGLPAGFVT